MMTQLDKQRQKKAIKSEKVHDDHIRKKKKQILKSKNVLTAIKKDADLGQMNLDQNT